MPAIPAKENRNRPREWNLDDPEHKREVGELMSTTAAMLEQSILATQQQRSAADQVAEAMIQIRESAGQLAADQTQREETSQRVEHLMGELDSTLARFGVTRLERAA